MCTLGSKSGHAKLLPQELYSVSQNPASRILNCVCEPLCSIWFALGSISRMWSKVSEKPKDSYFGVWECSKLFPYKLMGIAFSFYTISVYKSFNRNALLSESERAYNVFLH